LREEAAASCGTIEEGKNLALILKSFVVLCASYAKQQGQPLAILQSLLSDAWGHDAPSKHQAIDHP